jgi:hypothetical protein
VHWSTWYNLRSLKSQDGIASSVYESNLAIPRMAQAAYYAKMQEWWKTNPPWSSDEHELCVWITNQDPDFFSREFPFIGYVQVRIEGETRGLQLKSLSVKVSSAVSLLPAHWTVSPARAQPPAKKPFASSSVYSETVRIHSCMYSHPLLCKIPVLTRPIRIYF